MKKTILMIVAVVVGGGVGYVVGVRHTLNETVPALSVLRFSHLSKVMDDAARAYATGDTAVAVWALERSAEHIQAHQDDYLGDIFQSAKTAPVDLMLTYGRLAKVLRSSDPARSAFYMNKAVEIGSHQYTNEALTEARVLEIVDRLDKSHLESEQAN